MKQLPRIILYLFLSAVMLWSIYYVISMTDCCGIKVGEKYSDEAFQQLLPEKSVATFGSFKGENCYFQNRFGNIVYVHRNDKMVVTEINCYDRRFATNSWFGLLQIKPGMDIGQIISKVGLPISFGGSGIERAWVDLSTGERVMVFLDNVRGERNLVSNGYYQIWSNSEETERFQITGWLYPGMIFAFGIITAAVIIFQLKRKGLLCKKKQAAE